MRLLLSAYACEPGRGSEPGVGWNWALELARLGHDVWTLTRANNRESIENALRTTPDVGRLRFLYYDLPQPMLWIKRSPPGLYAYYFLWQIGAYRTARRAHELQHFEHVLHVTIGSYRMPSFMGELEIPFTFGPVGGGETTPKRLREGYGPRGRLGDSCRDLMNAWVRHDPLMNRTFSRAQRILVKTDETARWIHDRHQAKIHQHFEVGVRSRAEDGSHDLKSNTLGPFRILYVGRLLYWKGIHLGLRAFSEHLKKHPDSTLTLVGAGSDETRLKRLATSLGIDGAIRWMPWIEQSELASIYHDHDAFLLPSLHDSSGNALLEAMSYGLPVICLELGGPGVLIDSACGRVIPARQRSESEVIGDLAEALDELGSDDDMRSRLSRGALAAAQARTWRRAVGSAVALIQKTPSRPTG